MAASSTVRYGMTITTVDPAQALVKGVMKGDAQERTILIMEVPNAFRWPQEGEFWMITQKNGTWYLEGIIPSTTTQATLQGFPAGDLMLGSATGVIHVVGSTASDFTVTAGSFPTRGMVSLTAGTVVVNTAAVTANSQISLTAQDNDTVGALRVSARTPGVSFTITSSTNTDHGLIAYLFYG